MSFEVKSEVTLILEIVLVVRTGCQMHTLLLQNCECQETKNVHSHHNPYPSMKPYFDSSANAMLLQFTQPGDFAIQEEGV